MLRSRLLGLALCSVTVGASVVLASPVSAAGSGWSGPRTCAPSAAALSFSDALDKVSFDGATVGGLSDLAYDSRSHAWAATVDNHGTDPSRIWFFRDLTHPRVVKVLVLKKPDGTPYDGTTADDEGLVVLPNGDYLVSSETEPAIRIFGRDGVQKASLPVPARFAVTPAGEATANATLEGLTITPSGSTVIAAMEGSLSGDHSATAHRFLVYRQHHGGWQLDEQIAYATEPGQRVPEVTAYTDDAFLVEEASFVPATGNAVKLYAVTGLQDAPDVSSVADLSTAPARDFVRKQLIADLVSCPTLGATAKQPQTNPLMDNYEGLAVTFGPWGGVAGISLISDDNFGATQITRVLNLAARLP